MRRPPDHDTIASRLRRSGLSRAAAERMAGEWLDHLDDLAAAARDGGAPEHEAIDEAMARLGSPADLIARAAALPHAYRAALAREHIAVALRWSGAGVVGLCLTAGLFAAISAAIGI